jgi:hypothetical protein
LREKMKVEGEMKDEKGRLREKGKLSVKYQNSQHARIQKVIIFFLNSKN